MKSLIKGNWCVRCTDPKDESFKKVLSFLNKDKFPSKRWTGRENFYYGILNGNPIRGGWTNKNIKGLPKIEIEIVGEKIICKKDTKKNYFTIGKVKVLTGTGIETTNKGIFTEILDEKENNVQMCKKIIQDEIDKFLDERNKKFAEFCEKDDELKDICNFYGAEKILNIVIEYNKIKDSIETLYWDKESILSDKIDINKIEKHIKNTGSGVSIYITTLSFEEYCKEKKYFWIVKKEHLQKIYDFTNGFLKIN